MPAWPWPSAGYWAKPGRRWIAKSDQSGLMREGDWRDWEAIGGWATDLARTLVEPAALPQAA